VDDAAPVTILLVEDDAAYAFLVSEVLGEPAAEDTRLKVVHRDRLASAAAYLREHRVDCVLLDLGLPDGQGPANVTALAPLCPDTPILVLSGHDDEPLAVAARAAGAHAYVVKGGEVDGSLRAAVRRALGRCSESP
jgi:DNA-binding NarL/FixJ family response regulator